MSHKLPSPKCTKFGSTPGHECEYYKVASMYWRGADSDVTWDPGAAVKLKLGSHKFTVSLSKKLKNIAYSINFLGGDSMFCLCQQTAQNTSHLFYCSFAFHFI